MVQEELVWKECYVFRKETSLKIREYSFILDPVFPVLALCVSVVCVL